MEELLHLLRSKSEKLFCYSSFSFLKKVDRNELTEKTVINPIVSGIKEGELKVKNIKKGNENHYFIEKFLKWDSDFFQIPSYKIELIICTHTDSDLMRDAIQSYIGQIPKNAYCFIDIPTENTQLLQAMSNTKFKLIETRLNYYFPIPKNYSEPRYPVRKALVEDIDTLRNVAAKMRNIYDRVHADSSFTDDVADAYLAKFAEESVKGFADFVLVPDLKNTAPFGFLAANMPVMIEKNAVSKFVLAAIDSSVEKGLLHKLVTEMIYLLRENNADYLTTITQSANKAAINVWEKSGFKLYSVSHIYSLKK